MTAVEDLDRLAAAFDEFERGAANRPRFIIMRPAAFKWLRHSGLLGPRGPISRSRSVRGRKRAVMAVFRATPPTITLK